MSLAAAFLLLGAAAPVFAEPPLPDADLATQRGGFRLPNGIDVALTVQSQTAVNGIVVLRTVFAVDQGPATLDVYAPRAGATVAAGRTDTSGRAVATPQVTYDGRHGIQVTPGVTRTGVSIGSQPGDPLPDGLVSVDAASGAATANGVIRQSGTASGQTVRLDGADLSIAHLTGKAFGTVIANTGSDRTIDTSTTLSIDVRNAAPDVLGSALLRVEGLATGVLAERIR